MNTVFSRFSSRPLRHRLLSGTALALLLGGGLATGVRADCEIVDTTATCTGDVSAGVPDLINSVDTLIIEDTTTVLGGRSIFFFANDGNLKVAADFAPQGLVNDPSGQGRTEQSGVNVYAFGGSADVTLNGDMTIQAGQDVDGTTTVLTDYEAGVRLLTRFDLTLDQTGDVVVTHGDLTVSSDVVAGVDTEDFSGISAIAGAQPEEPGDLVINRTGDLTVTGPNMTATATDDDGSNRVIVNTASSSERSVVYGLLGIAGGDITVNNTGDISVNAGNRTGTVSSVGGRAEAAGGGMFTTAFGLPDRPFTQFNLGNAVSTPRSDTVRVDHTGDISAYGGDTMLTATSQTATDGPLSSAVVQYDGQFFSNDRTIGVNIRTPLNLFANFTGDINVDGGTLTLVADALAGDAGAGGLVSATGFGSDALGADIRGDSVFTENNTDNDGVGVVSIDGAISVLGGSTTAEVSGTGIASAPVSGFPPPADAPAGAINVGGGAATGMIIGDFYDETTISANPDTQSRTIERVGQVDVTVTDDITAQGGDVQLTLNGGDLPAQALGGQALAFSTGSTGVTLTTPNDITFTARGGNADVILNGSHGYQLLTGGFAQGANVDLQSDEDVTFAPDVLAVGGNANLTGDAGRRSEENLIAPQDALSAVVAGAARGLSIVQRPTLFLSEQQALTPEEEVALLDRDVILTGDITAVGGDATATDEDDVFAVGGSAIGVSIGFATNVVLQGDVTATGGQGTTRDGTVAGVTFDDSFFYGPTTEELSSFFLGQLRIEGSVTASGQGQDVADLSSLPNTALTTSLDVGATASAGVRAGGPGRVGITVADGGTVTTSGDYVHGIVSVGEDVTITVESGGSVTAQGSNANGIDVRPYQATGFAFATEALASDVAILIEDGATVVSNQGTGIVDDDRRQAVDFSDVALPRIVETYANTTSVDLAGTVTGGNGMAIDLGRGADDLTLRPTAVVNGDIDLGAGNDTLVLFDGAQVNGGVDFGLGDDLLAFDGAAGTVSNISLFSNGAAFAVGFERLEKRGEGTWIFGGDDLPALTPESTGRIIEGTSVVNANFVSVNLINEVNGRLEGTGGVRSLVNSGSFAPGGAGQISDFEIAEDLVLAADGTLEVDIDAPDNSDRVIVGGATTLDGTLAVNALGMTSDFGPGNAFTIIESAGGITGEFADIMDNLPDLELTLDVTGTAVVLGFEGDLTDLSDKSVHPNALQAAMQSGRTFANLLQGRSGMGLTTAINPTGDMVSTQGAVLGAGRHVTWGSLYGATRDVDGSGGVTGYDAGTGGLAVGYEYVMNGATSNTVLGFALAYDTTHMNSGPSSAEIDAYHIGLYGGYEANNWRFTGALTYGTQDYDIERRIPVGPGMATADGDADGTVFAASAKLAYNFAPALGLDEKHNMRFAPYIRLDHVSVDRDGYTESGAGVLNLAVGSDSFSQNSVSLGLELSGEMRNAGGTIARPYFDIHWEHVFDGRRATSNSFLAGTPAATFSSAGAFEETDRIGIGAGISLELSESSTFDLRYSGSFASGYTHHAASVGFRMEF
ncbi:autotransporter domain-containing protein [Thalassococcus sp. BH17M4-6]|uniref:autotransporter domain-containing protein n=1 Tax=Thalassococcus sp. BH17M4-6 TaxID=3413148 RepID=UPI003BEAA933